MATKRKASNPAIDHPQVTQRIKAEPGTEFSMPDFDSEVTTEPQVKPEPAPGAADPPQAICTIEPHDPLTRETTLYCVTWCEVHHSRDGEEEVLARQDLGVFMTLTSANRAAYKKIGGPEGSEQYKKEFNSGGLLTVSAVYWGIGHSIVTGRATVTKETVTVPPSYAVM